MIDDNLSEACAECPGRCCKRRFGFTGIGLTREEACSELFRPHRERVSGVETRTAWQIPMGKTGCPFLKKGRCSIYERRPLACRQFVCYEEALIDPSVHRCIAGYPALSKLLRDKDLWSPDLPTS